MNLRAGSGRRAISHHIEQWSSPTFELVSDRPVPTGIDGEAIVLDPPLRFRILPGALRVRIAPKHPGASPSALEPDSPLETIGVLMRIAFGSPVGDGLPTD